jgi:hypothetical protein
MWQDWVNAVVGLAIIGVALFGGLGVTLGWTFGILGAVVVILGIWGASVYSGEGSVKHA